MKPPLALAREARDLAEKLPPGPMYAVPGGRDGPHGEPAGWTIGMVPDEPGWETDGGMAEYGLKREAAEFYARARTLVPELAAAVEELLQIAQRLADCEEPREWDADGRVFCRLCGANLSLASRHAASCPWLRARRAVGMETP